MKNRIAYHIVSLLYLNGKVRIPGIGKITHERHKAELHKKAGTIDPPQASSSFSEGKNGGRLLEKYLSYKDNASRTEARRELVKFSRDVKNGLKNDGKLELDYLGTFSLHDDKLVFAPNEGILNPGSVLSELPLPARLTVEEVESAPVVETTQAESTIVPSPMEFTFVPEQKEVTPPPPAPVAKPVEPVAAPIVTPPAPVKPVVVTPRPTPAPVKEEKRRFPIAIPIAALILLAMLVAAFLFYQNRVSHHDSADATEQADVQERVADPSTADNTATSADEHKDYPETKVALADTGSRDAEAQTTEEETPVPPAPVEETVSSPASESVHAATEDCLVVVGAFSMTANVDRMVSRLSAMGYTTEVRPRGALTQVAVPVNCKTTNLSVVLDFMRKNIEPQAWVLKPR